MIVQVYEIQTPQEAEQCIELGVDHVGSVLLGRDRWRQPLIRDVVRLSEGTAVKNSVIPLFLDPDMLARAIDYYRPDFVHFCETLTDEQGRKIEVEPYLAYQGRTRERFPEVGFIRSIPIPGSERTPEFPTLEIAAAFEPVSDLFLTDTWLGKEPVEGYIGITGMPVDGNMAARLVKASGIPVILAGGLSPDNVYESAVEIVPAGVDSCTLTNAVDARGNPVRFRKDFDRVSRFVEEVRRAEKELRVRKEQMEDRLGRLMGLLEDRKAALPPHSVRPAQLVEIEELEERLASEDRALARLAMAAGV